MEGNAGKPAEKQIRGSDRIITFQGTAQNNAATRLRDLMAKDEGNGKAFSAYIKRVQVQHTPTMLDPRKVKTNNNVTATQIGLNSKSKFRERIKERRLDII